MRTFRGRFSPHEKAGNHHPSIREPTKNILWKSEAGDVPFQENIARVRKGRGFKRRERVPQSGVI
jgi:hypothetical protein